MHVPTAPPTSSRAWFWCRALILAVTLPVIVAFWLPLALRVPTYEVRDGRLIARSVAARVVIPGATPVREVTLTRLRRVAGSALPGYCTGTFSSREYRRIGLLTDCSPHVLVFDTKGRPTAISPADPGALLAALHGGASGTFVPAMRPHVDGATIFFTLLMLSVPLLLFVPLARMTYRVENGKLIVKTLTGAFRLPLRDARVSLTPGFLGLKLMGTGLPGYYTGTYAFSGDTSGPKSVQAFATSLRPERAVLLRHGKTTYYLTPADPAAFLTLLHEHAGEHAAHEVGEGRRADGA